MVYEQLHILSLACFSDLIQHHFSLSHYTPFTLISLFLNRPSLSFFQYLTGALMSDFFCSGMSCHLFSCSNVMSLKQALIILSQGLPLKKKKVLPLDRITVPFYCFLCLVALYLNFYKELLLIVCFSLFPFLTFQNKVLYNWLSFLTLLITIVNTMYVRYQVVNL